jgi:hypothetical protein
VRGFLCVIVIACVSHFGVKLGDLETFALAVSMIVAGIQDYKEIHRDR